MTDHIEVRIMKWVSADETAPVQCVRCESYTKALRLIKRLVQNRKMTRGYHHELLVNGLPE